ncbi:MAG: phosphatase PAP2 family protein [Bacteroidota bacterium]|nr:phosphatase PAP2 family protein [Bacteroidota bacterium]
MMFSEIFRKNRYFTAGFLVFLIALVWVMATYSKADGFYLLNPWHPKALDDFFIYYTNLGNGFFSVVVSLGLFAFRKRFLALMVMVDYAISGILAQVLKHLISEARPAIYLKDSSYPYFIDHVTLHNFQSFPSGHTASAFALATALALATKNRMYGLLFLLGAIMVGYSRIYLGQHFPDDVLVGSLLGFVTSVLCWKYWETPFRKFTAPRVKG